MCGRTTSRAIVEPADVRRRVLRGVPRWSVGVHQVSGVEVITWWRERRERIRSERAWARGWRQRESVARLERRGMHVNHLNSDGSENPHAMRAAGGAVLMIDSYTASRALVLPNGRVRYLWNGERSDLEWWRE